MKISRSPLVALFVLLFAVAGCGGGSSGSTGRSVQGLVVNERGHPVSGAEVSLLADGRSHLASAATATTSVDGSFQLTDVPAGNYTLSVRVDGPRGVTVEVQILVS